MLSKGNLIVLSAASGSGKTSLVERVLGADATLTFSVSHTTRKPRGPEQDGVEYFFVTEKIFQTMVESGEFLEYACVYGHYYGTSKRFVETRLAAGLDVLLDIDVQGAAKVKAAFPEAILIFVLPPSYAVLRDRLTKRGLDDPKVIERRLAVAREEIRSYCKYDYLLVNDDIDKTVFELESIVLAARCTAEKRRQRAEEIVETFFAGERDR